MVINIPVRSKCCEAPVKAGFRKVKNSNKRIQIWICLNCKKKDCDLLPFINGKVVRPSYFAGEVDKGTEVEYNNGTD